MYLCQVCGAVLCGDEHGPVWRLGITGHAGAGNVCPECFVCYEQARKREEQVGWPRREVRRIAECEELEDTLRASEQAWLAGPIAQREYNEWCDTCEARESVPAEEQPEWL